MLEPIETYRGIEIRGMRVLGRSTNGPGETLRYFCVVRGHTLADHESLASLKKKIDMAIDQPSPADVNETLPQRMYRIIGISPDGRRTTLVDGLPEAEALHLRTSLVGDARFSKLRVERDSAS